MGLLLDLPGLRRAQARAAAEGLAACGAGEDEAADGDLAPESAGGEPSRLRAVAALGQAALDRHEAAVASELVVLHETSRIACRAGCDHCCSLEVHASFPELAALAEHLRATRGPEALAALQARLATRGSEDTSMTAGERATVSRPCVLLENALCSVYEARPLACRGWTSASEAPCREARERPDAQPSIPVTRSLRDASVASAQGLRDGIREMGLDDRRLELTAGLHALLGDPELVATAWLEGRVIDAAMVATPTPRRTLGDDGRWRVDEPA